MDSSSEDGYLWEKCSSSDSEVMAHEEESDFDKRYKKKLQKELFQNGDLNNSQGERVHKKKKIKHEPGSNPAVKDESDSDARARPALNGHVDSDAERFLELKVKEEQASFVAPRDSPRAAGSGDDAPRKRKKAKKERRAEPDADEPPKKKKKKKHKHEADETDVIVDKFEAEETVVESRRPPADEPEYARDEPFTSTELVEDVSDSAPRGDLDREEAREPEPAPARPSTIRERITYEEESRERASPPPDASPARAGRLARYLRAHAHLAAVAAPPERAVSADDDVWLVRAPRGLGAAALAGAALAPGACGRLRAGGRGYEAAPAGCGARAALLGGGAGWRVRGVRVRGALQLRERVPRVRAPAAAPPAAPEPVALPATRARHPLLGVDYERAPAPRPRAPAAEPAGRDEPERCEKKKKKKKEKRKRERTEAAEGAPRSPSPLPRKKPRRAAPAADVWDSERAIEESLFNF